MKNNIWFDILHMLSASPLIHCYQLFQANPRHTSTKSIVLCLS